jgi:pimeloyl-ACP methyl ester carboxylesterase
MLVAALTIAVGDVREGFAQDQQAVDSSLIPYASTRDSVRLSDGRMLHLVCMGTGSPVVILTAGAGQWSVTWNKVQPKVAEKTRVCAWDRASFGMSTPPASPQTALERTTDLQEALKTSGINGPYVLVGHSLGSYDSLMFTDREPDSVAGMVLVDPSYPGQFAVFRRIAPRTIAWVESQAQPLIDLFRICAADLRGGKVWKGTDDPRGCLKPPWPPGFPPDLSDAVMKSRATAGPESYANYFDAQIAFQGMRALETDSPLAINPRRDYGNMPLIVLTAGVKDSLPPTAPRETLVESDARDTTWRSAHTALAALSRRGVSRVVEGSAHSIQQLEPQAVIDAVNEVVDQARLNRR